MLSECVIQGLMQPDSMGCNWATRQLPSLLDWNMPPGDTRKDIPCRSLLIFLPIEGAVILVSITTSHYCRLDVFVLKNFP